MGKQLSVKCEQTAKMRKKLIKFRTEDVHLSTDSIPR